MQLPVITTENLYALSAIINSTIFSVLARSIANPQSNGYFKFNKQFLDPVPFPSEYFRTNHDGLVNQLAELAQEISEQQQRYISSSPAQKKTLAGTLQRNWTRLDDLVYQLYQLSDSDIAEFISRGRNVNRISILD
jgi:hypothetical protein